METKKLNYWNPTTRKYATIVSYICPGLAQYYIVYEGDKTWYEQKSFGAAVDKLTKAGFEVMGFLDSEGCRRYTMTLPQLNALYKQLEEFIADCTQEEFNANKAAIIAVYTLIHQHINAETYK